MANLGLQNNNPGNLRDPQSGNFRVFNTPEEGHQALLKDINTKQSGKSQHIKPGASIAELGNVWAPPSDNNVSGNWATNVAKYLGVPTAYAFDKVPADKLAEGIKVAEGTNTMKNDTQQTNTSQKFKLTHDQMTANIDAMEKQGAKPEEVQGYLDSLKGDSQALQFPLKTQSQEQTSQSTDPHTGTLGTNPNDDWYGKTIDNSLTRGVMKFGDFMTGGGSTQLGDVNSSVKDKLIGAGKTAASIAGLAVGGEAISGLMGAVKGGTALASEPVASILTDYAGEDAVSSLSSAEKVNALTEALSTSEAGIKPILSRALSELGPKVLKEAGIGSFSELNPTTAKALGLGWKAVKFLTRTAADIGGLQGIKYLLK